MICRFFRLIFNPLFYFDLSGKLSLLKELEIKDQRIISFKLANDYLSKKLLEKQ